MTDATAKTCFVISQIGGEGTPERRRADQVLNYIIAPVVAELGYAPPMRSDKIALPGVITGQIIERLMEDDLVVADLTGSNANVFYELAIRHAVRKPVVQLIGISERIPFDVSHQRTIILDVTDLDSVEAAKEAMRRQIGDVEGDAGLADSPLSAALDVLSYRRSGDPEQHALAGILDAIQQLSGRMGLVEDVLRRGRSRTELPRVPTLAASDTALKQALGSLAPDPSKFSAALAQGVRDDWAQAIIDRGKIRFIENALGVRAEADPEAADTEA